MDERRWAGETMGTAITMLQPIDSAAWRGARRVLPTETRWDDREIAGHVYAVVRSDVADWPPFNCIVRYTMAGEDAPGNAGTAGYALALEESADTCRCPFCGSEHVLTEPGADGESWDDPQRRYVTGRLCLWCGLLFDRAEHPSHAEVLSAQIHGVAVASVRLPSIMTATDTQGPK